MIGKNQARSFQSLENRLAYVPAGLFTMGSREGGPGNLPREVAVERFQLGRYEVTAAEYAAYLNDAQPTNAVAHPPIVLSDGEYLVPWRQRNRPAAFVSFDDAAAYCVWLSERTGRKVRLPTEAEWECAARGGIRQARYPWGWGDAKGRACFDAEGPEPVGSFDPNAFGLYDMAGNVFEWCASEPGAEAGATAFVRGGSWAEKDPRLLRVYHRVELPREYRDADVGFRVLVEPSRKTDIAQAR